LEIDNVAFSLGASAIWQDQDLIHRSVRMKSAILLLSAVCALTLGACAAAARPHVDAPKGQVLRPQALASQATLDLSKARAIALKARPGKIVDQELEKEAGGSGLRYSFDIKVRKATYEVGIDAKTGAVLENAKEGPHPD
jgi:hypothetical protein